MNLLISTILLCFNFYSYCLINFVIALISIYFSTLKTSSNICINVTLLSHCKKLKPFSSTVVMHMVLYDFGSDYADSLFKAWNIQVRLDWDTPPTSWLVEGYFCDQNAMFKESDHEQISKFCEETFRFTKQRSKILEPRVTE